MWKISLTAFIALAGIAAISTMKGDWNTSANDAQRSLWVRGDSKISLTTLRKPGLSLVWKHDFHSQVSEPALLDFYIGYRGFRALGYFGLQTGRVVTFDTELGRLEWERDLGAKSLAGGAKSCGAEAVLVTRPLDVTYPPLPTSESSGRGTPAKSGVGKPFEGAVTLKASPVVSRRPAAGSGSGKPAAFTPPPNPFTPHLQYVLALTHDGKLHLLNVSNGEETQAPLPFVPAHSNVEGLVAYGDSIYTTSVGGCGGSPDGVWALDLPSKKVTQWKSPSRVAGTLGAAAGPDGTLYVSGTGGDLTALAPGTLQQTASHRFAEGFASSPMVFEFHGKNLIAAVSAKGRLELFDAAALDRESPLTSSAAFDEPKAQSAALASWQDWSGVRWILASAEGTGAAIPGFSMLNGDVSHGAIVAWKVLDNGSGPTLEPVWRSRDLFAPAAPLIVNGVVFALSTGDVSAAERGRKGSSAVLYALEPLTGTEVWNSSNFIVGTAKSDVVLAAGGTRVYVSTRDGIEYAFGFPMEH